jgi:hypothetical protein
VAWNDGRPLRQASEASEILDAISEFRKAAEASSEQAVGRREKRRIMFSRITLNFPASGQAPVKSSQ